MGVHFPDTRQTILSLLVNVYYFYYLHLQEMREFSISFFLNVMAKC